MRFIYTKTFSILASLIVVVAVFVLLELKGLLGPISSAVLYAPRPVIFVLSRVTVPAKNFFSTIYQLNKISKENALLSNKVFLLQQDLADYDQATKENQALKAELGFVQTTTLKTASCSVLSQNPLGLSDSLVLNCGSGDGVSEGQAVVSSGYLIAKIVYAGKNSSTALLITSSNFSTDAMVSKSGADGVIHGSFGSGLILDQLSQQDQVSAGDLVVTAGINKQIPKNILIGEIGDIISNPNDVFKRTTVSSPVDFDNLQFVFVVQ